MLSKTLYNKFNKKIIKSIGRENIIEYDVITQYWDSLIGINLKKGIKAKSKSFKVEIGYLQTLEWGILSLCLSDNDDNNSGIRIMCKSLFVTISNTALAIIKMSIDGLEYQASILLRNLYEECYTLLNVIISPQKRSALFESVSNENEYKVWKDYFSLKKLDETISAYEKSVSVDGRDLHDILGRDWRKEMYQEFSGFVHNEFFNFITYSLSMPQNDDMMKFNLWGHYATRTDYLLGHMNDLLFYSGMLFYNLISNKEIDISKDVLCNENSHALWNIAAYLHHLIIEFYIYSKNIDDKKEKSADGSRI